MKKKWQYILAYLLIIVVEYYIVNRLVLSINSKEWFFSGVLIFFIISLPLVAQYCFSEKDLRKSKKVPFSQLGEETKESLIWEIAFNFLFSMLFFYCFIMLISKNSIVAIGSLVIGIISLYYLIKVIIKRDWRGMQAISIIRNWRG